MSRLNDRTGQVVGRLLVICRGADIIQANGRKRVQWLCRCGCGNLTFVEAGNLNSGHTKTCGCLVQDTCARIGSAGTHYATDTKEWLAWRGAINRTTNPRNPQYKNYGGRGIEVCSAWLTSFEQFLADMGACPSSAHSLERIDVNRGYCRNNCKWATAKEQMRNRRCTPRVTYKKKRIALADLTDQLGLPYRPIYDRIRRQGWSLHKALGIPIRRRNAVQTDVS